MKLSEISWFSNYARGDRSLLIHLNLLNIRIEIWKGSLITMHTKSTMTHLFLDLRMPRSTLISLTDDRKVIQGLCITRNHQRTVQYWIQLTFKLPILVFTFILAFIKMISSRGKSATMCTAVFLSVMCW